MHLKEKDFQFYLDNSLEPEKRRKAEQHITVCEVCRQRLNEWEDLFGAINELETEFPLDGLEEKILTIIKEQPMDKKEKGSRLPAFNLVLVSSFLAALGLFFGSFANITGLSFRYASNFILNESVDFINAIKWQAIDIISGIRFDNLSGWPVLFAAGIILIAGGVYLSLWNKQAFKA